MCHTKLLTSALAALAFASCSSGGGSTFASGSDENPPLAGTVADGLGPDADQQSSTTLLAANWTGFSDAEGPISYYEWAIGSTPGGTDIQPWTTVGTSLSASNNALTLEVGHTYYVSVRAYDGASNLSAVATSDGVEITPESGPGGPGVASSISQWGITWTFDREYPAGRFCNGDWWVVGPVTLVRITPACTTTGGRTVNGSMINPTVTGRHGYDSLLYSPYAGGEAVYDSQLNVALGLSATHPLTLQPSTSLISTIAQIGPTANGSTSQLRVAAVLTVLADVPAADAFRPPYSGTDKTIRHREADLNYGALAQLAPAADAPTLPQLAQQFQHVWLDHCVTFVSRMLHPVENMPDYYRDFTALTGSAALMLNCNFSRAQKRDLLVGLVQRGLDDYGNILNGARWPVSGHGNGRKFSILFAGRVLDDTAMLSVGTTYATTFFGPSDPRNVAGAFSEDGQTFYVNQTSPGVYNWGFGGYTPSQVGLPEWGNYHTTDTSSDSASWTASPYRTCCSANAWSGEVLTMRIMGLRTAWNQPAFFDYMDRYLQVETPGNYTFAWDPWTGRMWQSYRSQF